MRQLCSGSGRVLHLGAELGRGGEGAVFTLRETPQQAIKLYPEPLSADNQAKLRTMVTMVKMRSEPLSHIVAWPIDTVHDKPAGPVIGFTMPKVSGFKEIHLLYGPKSRVAEFPAADWAFLLHSALNLARAFSTLHDHDIVIGDVNHGNAVVSERGTIMFWDCDSFQVTHSGKVFHCEVGVPTHTPPELQGQSLRGVVRTKNHDAFGLAVLVFQLLFLGRHPFAGVYLGRGDMSLERAIREHRFAYGSHAPSYQMRQPPAVPPLSIVGPSLPMLFERAFTPAGTKVRPSPTEWATSLASVLDNLSRCSVNTSHVYLKTLSSCPWCQVDRTSGIMTFRMAISTTTTQPVFDLDVVWAEIVRAPSPGGPPPIPSVSSFSVQQTPEAAELAQRLADGRSLSWGLTIVALIAIAIFAQSILAGVLAALVTKWAVSAIAQQGTSDAEKRLRSELAEAHRHLQELALRWDREGSDQVFRQRMQQLEWSRQEYQKMGALRDKKLHELQANLRQRQLEKYLDRQRIDGAPIPGIGPTRTATLQSWGIETALDVSRRSLSAVPGFGPSLTSRMMDWRSALEKRFVFNAAQGPDPPDVAAVEREIAAMRSQLQQDLLRGAQDLLRLSHHIHAQRKILLPLLDHAVRAIAQAEANLQGI